LNIQFCGLAEECRDTEEYVKRAMQPKGSGGFRKATKKLSSGALAFVALVSLPFWYVILIDQGYSRELVLLASVASLVVLIGVSVTVPWMKRTK
jgi:hypothetical protein